MLWGGLGWCWVRSRPVVTGEKGPGREFYWGVKGRPILTWKFTSSASLFSPTFRSNLGGEGISFSIIGMLVAQVSVEGELLGLLTIRATSELMGKVERSGHLGGERRRGVGIWVRTSREEAARVGPTRGVPVL